jgi:hypothetical protein
VIVLIWLDSLYFFLLLLLSKLMLWILIIIIIIINIIIIIIIIVIKAYAFDTCLRIRLIRCSNPLLKLMDSFF